MAEPRLKNGWRSYRFDQMASMINDRIDNPQEVGVDRYVGLEHMDPESLRIRRWGVPSDVTATKLLFRKGDIIFGRRRVYQRKLALADFDGICSAHAMVLRAKPAVVLPEFLPFYMQSDMFMERAKEISVGSLSPTINWKTLAKEEFALPPLDEQRRLCQALAAAWSAIEAYRGAETRLRRLIASVRMRYFDPGRHTPVPLSSLCEVDGIKIGPFGAQLHQSDYVAEGIPVVMPRDMVDNRIVDSGIARVSETKAQSLAAHRIAPKDILLPRRGELDRRAYVTDENEGWLCGTGSIRIRVADGVPARAVLHALASPPVVRWLIANAVGSTMLNLNTKIVSRIPIALPPRSDLERVLSWLGEAEASLSELRTRVRTGRALFNRLLSEITGAAR